MGPDPRECLAAAPGTSISGRRVVRELTKLIGPRSKPGMIVSHNGTELISNAVVLARYGEIGVEWHYIAPGRPMQNDYVESVNVPFATSYSTRRCSSASPMPASRSLPGRRINRERLHSSPGYATP